MYVPPSFAVNDIKTLHAFMRTHSFATLVSTDNEEPIASHLPLLLDDRTTEKGRLIGHMARANTQWETASDRTVLAVFHGPHAYVSPSWYADKNVVPTWNYVAVHVYGTFRREDDPGRLRQILSDYVDSYESGMPQPWSLASENEDFVRSLTQAVMGFTVDIERIEGKWKLSQNQSASRRRKVLAGLQRRGSGDDDAVADLMTETLQDSG